MTDGGAGPYRIEPYEPGRLSDLLDLERELWSPDPAIAAAYFDWKYRWNPFGASNHFFMALSGDRVVGVNGLYWSRWEAGFPAETADVLCRADTIVLPEFRGRGIVDGFFAAIGRSLAATGHTWVFGTSAGRPVTRAGLAAGWQRCGSHQRWRRPPSGGLSQWLRRRRGRAVAFATRPLPEAMADLVGRIGHDGRIRHVRDAPYFAWRFENPLSRYGFFTAGTDALDGYLITQEPAGGGAVTIVDWEAAEDDTAAALVDALIDRMGGRVLAVTVDSLSAERRGLLSARDFRFHSSRDEHGFEPSVIVKRVIDDAPPAEWRMGGRPLLDATGWDWRDLYSDNH